MARFTEALHFGVSQSTRMIWEKAMGTHNLEHLPTFDGEALNVIVETPRNQPFKFKYDGESGVFRCEKSLPLGLAFPFDFGFLPSTLGGDGDPVDVLILSAEPIPTGSLVLAKLKGVQEAEQTENGKTVRNDRVIAIPLDAKSREPFQPMLAFNELLDKAIVEFFAAYNKLQGKELKALGTHGPERALEIVKEAVALCERKNKGKASKAAADD
jgi:inorganic pyrophosphatase